jgi:hypothetical protein
MATYNDTGYGTVTLAADTGEFIRVTAAGAIASATQQDIGLTTRRGDSATSVSVAFANKTGTSKATAAGAISLGAKVYTAASGKVSATQATGSFLRGIAMSAASSANDVIEILNVVGDSAGA